MAKYKIESLNKITSGTERSFLDMDVVLDTQQFDFTEYIHLLQLEQKDPNKRVLKEDVLLEQNKGQYAVTEFIAKEFNIPRTDLDEIKGTVDLSSLSKAVSEYQDKNAIILNEQQEKYIEDTIETKQYIRLILSCCTDDYRDNVIQAIANLGGRGKIYECESMQEGQQTNVLSGGHVVNPVYDTYDLHFKSRNRISNGYLGNFDNDTPRRTEDIYLPQTAKVCSMCQSDDTTVILTNPTNDSVQMLSSSLNGEDTDTGRYHMQLNCRKMKTFLFPSRQALADKLGQTLSSQSYADLLQFYQTEEAMNMYGSKSTDNFFNPVVNLDNIKYNYIAQVPMTGVRSEYRNGNVYCDIFNTKNVYDSTYSMQMSSIASLVHCREYTDVFTCGGKVYLKYYDNMNYTGNPGDGSPDLSSMTNINMNLDDGRMYTYQKVESFNPVAIRGQKNHKSLFFSVNISDVDMDDDSDNEQVIKLRAVIRHDITNAVREISRNVTPANTQLFDVYFGKMI